MMLFVSSQVYAPLTLLERFRVTCSPSKLQSVVVMGVPDSISTAVAVNEVQRPEIKANTKIFFFIFFSLKCRRKSLFCLL
ncbi:hypothetical protein C211_02865, partial [Stutzerimonas degradans]